MERRIFLKTE